MKKYIAVIIAVFILMSLAGCAASQSEAGGQVPQRLTGGDAQTVALEHAELTADQVTGLRTEYDLDDGIPQYEVEFRYGDYEYDYTIHAETGKILSRDKEYDPVKTTDPSTAPTEPVPEPNQPTAEPLTKDEAAEIALDHAKVAAEDVTGLYVQYEVDDGVPEYEIEFYCNGYEYEYTVHAETGKILSWDKEYDARPEPDKPTAALLTKDEAVSIALEHAGFTAEQVSRLQVEYDVDDGVPEYSVEFFADGYEYDYEIHAETGKILEWDKDRDR